LPGPRKWLLALMTWTAVGAGPDPTFLLANATGQAWKVRPEGRRGTPARISVVEYQPGRPARRFDLDFRLATLPELDLAAQGILVFSHREPPGTPVRVWFELLGNLPAGAAGPPQEGYLSYHTAPSLLPFRADQTGLDAAFYADGRPSRFRFTAHPGLCLLEDGAPNDGGCAIQ